MFWKNLTVRFKQTRLRLILIVTLVAAAASTLVFGILLTVLLRGFEMQDRMELDSRLLSYWAAWQYGGDQAVIDRASEDMKKHGGRPFLLMLKSPEDEILCALVPGAWEVFNLEDSMLEFLQPGTYVTLKKDGLGYDLRISGSKLDDGSRLMVGLSTENRQFLLSMYRRNYPWVLGAIIIAGLSVGFFSSRRLLAPIIRLNREIDRIIVTGELSRRLDNRGTNDELDELISRYNRLLERVENLISGMKGTLDAVAHDLRTPLTRLRGHAEMALQSAASVKPDEYAEVLATVVEQTDQAVALLSALMDISEAEQSTLHLDLEDCDLSLLASQVCDMYAFVAEEKNQSLKLDAPGPVPVKGDPVRLRQVLGNLLDNAVKYSPDGGSIVVRCSRNEDWGLFEVTDEGPGVPEEERGRIFERLYRGDRSRGSRGLGLGLSLVQALSAAHKGMAGMEPAPGGTGSRFFVKIPANISHS